jgi:hypothetical protein
MTEARFGFDAEAVRDFMPAYMTVRDELDAAGRYPYNADFVGRIPGLAGEPDEDRGIYLLQTLHKMDAEREQLAAFLAAGGYPAAEHDPTVPFRGTVVETGFYVGGTGWREHHDARLLFRNGAPYGILPPRRRTVYLLAGAVYLLAGAR